MNPTNTVLLEFDPKLNRLGKGKKLSGGLSVAVRIGDTLWVANDETLSLERLTLNPAGDRAGQHQQFSLADYLDLPAPPPANPKKLEEADLEGLDYADGYLWLVGSHSLKRKQPKPDEDKDFNESSESLAKVTSDGNRYLLARIPVDKSGGTPVLKQETERKGRKLVAARLRGDKNSNALTKALQEDEHLAPFLKIPSKDNGFDIEGLAVAGERLFIGLRGPVLRGWAVILEVDTQKDGGELDLKAIGPGGRPYRKHFLRLGGLGIRDLCVEGSDLLILAGPTLDLDGPVTVFHWPGGARPEQESFVSAGQLERLLDVPYGQGADHAEGMAWFSADGEPRQILLVYDSAAASRQPGENTMLADVFTLPA